MRLAVLTFQNPQDSLPKELEKEGKKLEIETQIISPKSKDFLFDVIYDQCFPGTKRESDLLKNFHKKCRERNIPIFNGYKLIRLLNNKWKFYKLLLRKGKFKNHLPPTFIYQNQKGLRRLLEIYPAIILKPRYGGMGEGIISLQEKKGLSLIQYQKKINHNFKIFNKITRGLSFLPKLMREMWRNDLYIIQPKIDVAEIRGRVFDIRVVVQKEKNYLGKWQISGIGARAAKKNGFLTNIHAGGEIFNGEKIIEKVFSQIARGVLNQIKEMSIGLAKVLEKEVKDLIGEIGIDFIVDKKGKIWLIEANSKPGRYIFYKKEMKDLKKKMTIAPLLFAKSLFLSKAKK
jgi:glutathione synthase/RimK-type ligase-like ATP-grasp enzyme